MATLNGTFSLAEVDDAAMMVAEHLNLDVARVLEIFLDIHVGHTKRRLGLALRGLDRVAELLRRAHHAHAAATTTGRRFYDYREAAGEGELERGFFVFDRTVRAGQQRQAGFLHGAPRARLVAHQPDHLRIGPDEPDMTGFADFGEVRRFRQESVLRMDRVGARDLRRADDRGYVQVALGAAGGADAHIFIRESYVQRVF